LTSFIFAGVQDEKSEKSVNSSLEYGSVTLYKYTLLAKEIKGKGVKY
jgi:hypothetical protein